MRAAKKASSTVRSRGRGPYNVACDVCARRKIKCDGNKPMCQPCHTQGREQECTWSKNPARKPRTEAYVEAMHKQIENLRKCNTDVWHYTESLESLLDEYFQDHPHRKVNFRAARPPAPDVLMGQPEDDADSTPTGGEDNDQGSDDGNNSLMAICIPPQSLRVGPFIQSSRFLLAFNPDDTYVLMVEGVQSSHHNPAFDWSRHLAKNVPLDRPSHDKALDLLFKFHTSWCLRIIPALFLRDMYRALIKPPSQPPPKTPHYSPMLHNALVALALAFSDEPFNDIKTRHTYANHAKSFIEDECRKPNLSVVQALSVLSSFHSSQGDQTLGFMYFGISSRMSQALGLNMDCSEWVKLGLMEETERVHRHWASWTNFTQDVCWSFYVGRDFCIAEPVGAKATPMPQIDPEFDAMLWSYSSATNPPQPNNLTKTFEATCRLLLIARRIMDVINGLDKARSRPLILDALISDIDVKLNVWKSSLPDDLDITPRSLLTATPHKLMLHLAYWWFFILLHRPFFLRKSRPIHSMDREIDHVKLCRRAAENIMELLSTWHTLYKLRYCPVTLIQTAFCAGTVYLLTAMQASSGIRIAQKELRRSLDQEALVRQYLEEVGLSWKCAKNISDNLKNLRNEQVMPLLDPLDRKSMPNPTAGLISADIGHDKEEDGPSNSPTITIPSAGDTSSTLATPSSPIAIPSQRSSISNPSSFPDSWNVQPSPGSSSNFNYLPSFANRGSNFQDYSQPFSNYIDNPFSGNGSGSKENVGHACGGQGSAHNIPSSSSLFPRHHYVGECLGMLGGQTLSEVPVVGLLSEVDTRSFNRSNSSFGIGFNHRAAAAAAASLGEHVPSSSNVDNDSMDLDHAWIQSFAP